MTELRTYTYGPRSGNAPKSLVILLHGLGANGQDLLGLAPEYASQLPDTVFVSPDAPFHCDMAPMGYQWFSLQEWTPESILRGVREATPILTDFIEQQAQKYNLPLDQVALVGFSQGTMMSLYVGPRLSQKIAGIVGYSGAFIEDSDTDMSSVQKPPVMLIHGMADMVVPVTAYYHAKDKLETAGFSVEGGTTPLLPHSIDMRGIKDGREFLVRVLG
ncbi:MAG: alpha/beta hydrolase [Micavibrio sp.]